MSIPFHRSLSAIACFAAFSFAQVITPDIASAQDSMQTGDGLLRLQAAMPDSARVGESFTYEVEVSNTSDNIVLHDIKLKQRKAKGFKIESVSIQGQSSNQDQKKESGNKDKQSPKQNAAKQEQPQDGKQSNREKGGSTDQMTIATLEPGDSRTFVVKATADQEGELRSCLEISNYTPALCLSSRIVKPELQLTKTAPKKADRCGVIEITYAISNDGSGDVGPIVITDSLGSGLATIDGSNELSFDVDGLAAGDSRKFVARVYAQKAGEFSSRAVAKAKNGDLKSRSEETSTRVIAADLTAQIDGPSRIYGDDLATFTAKITNTGNAAAESVNVTVNWPAEATLADMGDYEIRDAESSDQSKQNKGDGSQPTVASDNDSSKKGGNGNDQQSKDDSRLEMRSESFVIDRLDAGETAEFTYAVRADKLQELPTRVEARYVCTVDGAEDQAKSTAETSAMTMARVKVVRLPALQVAVIDDEDPVNDGSKVNYTITVWNEGDAEDQDVQVVATLPDKLKFDAADGPTNASHKKGTVTFDPIKKMAPGDRVEYTVTCKPTGKGTVRFEATLTSKTLKQEVTSEEPTRLFAASSN
ncbi:COG1361 family protein [Aporhodopirellula aestuarii]|uniref:DUF11 domain-containing protein n=1 Tax=Aporhodopirellula aestuarii TaxID=2950107 RepID=A0ABT0TYA7_9BACT|nr:DUF11 domain-containing protein [Aporhodopirellula aestuarii]MCM2369577.1 DUF11 domain-containing protein [Aporhodopirellula aestuarii]